MSVADERLHGSDVGKRHDQPTDEREQTRRAVEHRISSEAHRYLGPGIDALRAYLRGERRDVENVIDEIISSTVGAIAFSSSVVADVNFEAESAESHIRREDLERLENQRITPVQEALGRVEERCGGMQDRLTGVEEYLGLIQERLKSIATTRAELGGVERHGAAASPSRDAAVPPMVNQPRPPAYSRPRSMIERLRDWTVGLPTFAKVALTAGPPILMLAVAAWAQTSPTAPQNAIVDTVVRHGTEMVMAYLAWLTWTVYAHSARFVQLDATLGRLDAGLDRIERKLP